MRSAAAPGDDFDRNRTPISNVSYGSSDKEHRTFGNQIMSQYPPPSETEASAYTTYPPVAPNPDSHASLGYTPPGNPIDPNLGSAQGVQAEPKFDALQQLQDAAALQEAALTSQAATQAAAAAAAAQAARQADKQKRVAQACDACSQRKVKVRSKFELDVALPTNLTQCDEGNPCKNCSDLGVECTRNRQRRRRGPPNRVKERIETDKRARSAADLDVSTAAALGRDSQPFDPSSQSSADLIAPPDIVQRLLSEFFTYVYPIYPFPHEPWLMQAFNRRADIGDSAYNPLLGLISSMVALLAAMRPRQTLALISSLGYTNIDNFIHQVRAICVNARGIGYLDRDDLDYVAAATSFFLAQLSVRNQKWLQYQSYLNEAVEIVHDQQMMLMNDIGSYDSIQLQIGRRIYWSVYVCTRSMEHWINLQSRPGYLARAPAKPAVVDDDQISPDGVQDVPAREFGPLTLALDTLVEIYHSTDQILTQQTSPSDSDLIETVKRLRESIADWNPLTKELVNSAYSQRFNESNRAIRYEVQRVNLLTSHLILRLSLLEKRPKTSTQGLDSQQAHEEFTNIAQGLLFLFKDLKYHSIEYDQTFFFSRVQRITGSLAENDDAILKGPLYEAIIRFEGLLKSLVQADDDSDRFHAANELRVYQESFVKLPVYAEFLGAFTGGQSEA